MSIGDHRRRRKVADKKIVRKSSIVDIVDDDKDRDCD